MLEKILVHEREAFLLMNGSDSIFFDRFMWLYSGKVVWLPLAVFILFVLIYKNKWKESLLILLGIVLVITSCDQFASHLCKPLFTRFRPTHHPDFIDQVKTVFDYRGGRYGFMSSHTANAFGFATFISLILRNRLLTLSLFFWATLMAYTRIYLGVHFISDIVPGAIIGTIFGYLVHRIYLLSRPYLMRRGEEHRSFAYTVYALNPPQLIVMGIFSTILIMLAFNAQLIHFLA
ncbi:MAG: phosphatase PAP2 family protein [Tannerellaceae bacterium]|nr:phosphatase PAP2 family protein [Tannerellaceae bacterium]